MSDFKSWGEPKLDMSDEGDYGLFPSIDYERPGDGAKFHIHVYEDGTGGLVVNIYGTAGTKIDLSIDDDSEAEITTNL
ncbi:hypothetical protein [Mycobacteroides abscessus]|uniref:hypothetical protein n=1 Tax=Mycobacteroides abscessus TaxID=36809 RepID=UPI000C267E2A|nr:hypothetical protein [Mycobacteroides abscessus]